MSKLSISVKVAGVASNACSAQRWLRSCTGRGSSVQLHSSSESLVRNAWGNEHNEPYTTWLGQHVRLTFLITHNYSVVIIIYSNNYVVSQVMMIKVLIQPRSPGGAQPARVHFFNKSKYKTQQSNKIGNVPGYRPVIYA